MQCQYCGGTKLIKTEAGYRCRNGQCQGATQLMQAAVNCEDCGEEMEFKGLNSWGEPSYRCQSCGTTVKL